MPKALDHRALIQFIVKIAGICVHDGYLFHDEDLAIPFISYFVGRSICSLPELMQDLKVCYCSLVLCPPGIADPHLALRLMKKAVGCQLGLRGVTLHCKVHSIDVSLSQAIDERKC